MLSDASQLNLHISSCLYCYSYLLVVTHSCSNYFGTMLPLQGQHCTMWPRPYSFGHIIIRMLFQFCGNIVPSLLLEVTPWGRIYAIENIWIILSNKSLWIWYLIYDFICSGCHVCAAFNGVLATTIMASAVIPSHWFPAEQRVTATGNQDRKCILAISST